MLHRFVHDLCSSIKLYLQWKKSVNRLAKAEWDVDLLVYLVKSAARHDVKITLHNADLSMVMTFEKAQTRETSQQYTAPESYKAFREYIGAGEDG